MFGYQSGNFNYVILLYAGPTGPIGGGPQGPPGETGLGAPVGPTGPQVGGQ
jgi:hypothetical protein